MQKTFVKKRIFLSYGHDTYASLAARLKHDLEKRDHQVWFDLERLRAGVDWEAYIEEGLEWVSEIPNEGLFLLLMTPHSVRRPDGFCHNELNRAISRQIPVVPVMVSWCEPPLSICRIQYLDMQDCWPLQSRERRYQAKFARLLEAVVQRRLDFEGAQARLLQRLDPLPFDADIQKHLSRFTGRKWVFKRIDEWLADPDASRVFWISGKPGVGKSALSSWLCYNRPETAAFHFCVHGHTQKSDPRRAVLSVAYQLSSHLPDYRVRVNNLDLEEIIANGNAKTLFDNLIVQPLAANFPSPNRTVVIVIDALDEATSQGTNALALLIASEFQKTPRWMRLLITSRPEQMVTEPLQALTPYILDTSTPDNEKDLREYLLRELKPFSRNGRIRPETVDTILEKSEGLFLYAEYICRELDEKRLSLDHIDEFPQGLGGIYDQFFRRQFPDIPMFEDRLRPVIEVITAARDDLEVDCLTSLFNWSDYDRREILEKLGSLFPVSSRLIAPFHRSVLDWLSDESKAGHYFISVKQGTKRLADYGWREYERGVDSMSTYSTVHLPAHLSGVVNRQLDLRRLLLDFDWLQAKLNTSGAVLLLADFNYAQGDPDIILVRETIGLSIQSLTRNENELPSQLLGRLRPMSNSIRKLLDQASGCKRYQWLRPLEGNLTPAGGALRFALKGHFASIDGLQITADSRYLVSSSGDGMIKVWDLMSGNELHTLKLPAQILDLAVTPDSKRVIAASDVGALGVWDLESGALLHILSGHRHWVNKVAVIPPGSFAISSAHDGSLIIWNLLSGELVHEFPNQSAPVSALAVSNDGRLGATGSHNGILKVWDLHSKKELHSVKAHRDGISAVGIADRSGFLITASNGGEVKVWELESAQLLKTLQGHCDRVNDIATSANGRNLLSASSDGTVAYWDMTLGQRISTLEGHNGHVWCVELTTDGKKAVSASDDSTVKVWDLSSGTQLRSLMGHAGSVIRLSLTEDGLYAASGATDSTIRIWNITVEQEVSYAAKGHSTIVRSIVVAKDGRCAISGSQDGTIKIWDLANLDQIRTLTGHRDWVHGVALTSDATRIVSGSSDHTVKIWDTSSGSLLRSLECSSRVVAVALTNDDEYVFSVTTDGKLTAWSLESGTKIYDLELSWNISYGKAIAVAEDGSRVVVGPHLTVDCWNLHSQQKENTLGEDSLEEVTAIALTPDGKVAAVASGVSNSSFIKVWNLGTGDCLHSIKGPPCRVNDLVFFPDGRRFVYAADYGWVGVWDLETSRITVTYSTDWSIFACAITPDGRHVIVGDESGRLHFLRVEG